MLVHLVTVFVQVLNSAQPRINKHIEIDDSCNIPKTEGTENQQTKITTPSKGNTKRKRHKSASFSDSDSECKCGKLKHSLISGCTSKRRRCNSESVEGPHPNPDSSIFHPPCSNSFKKTGHNVADASLQTGNAQTVNTDTKIQAENHRVSTHSVPDEETRDNCKDGLAKAHEAADEKIDKKEKRRRKRNKKAKEEKHLDIPPLHVMPK